MAQIRVYLGFTDNCKEAMEFYQSCLGGQLEVQTVGESPVSADMPAEVQNQVLHASLTRGNLTLMASDMMQGGAGGSSVNLVLQCDDPQEAETLFSALSSGGTVTQPLTPSFWGSHFGQLTDRYGFSWMVDGPSATA